LSNQNVVIYGYTCYINQWIETTDLQNEDWSERSSLPSIRKRMIMSSNFVIMYEVTGSLSHTLHCQNY